MQNWRSLVQAGPILSHGSAAPCMSANPGSPSGGRFLVPASMSGGAVHTSEVVHEKRVDFYLKKQRGTINTLMHSKTLFFEGLALFTAILPAGWQKMLLMTQPARLTLDS